MFDMIGVLIFDLYRGNEHCVGACWWVIPYQGYIQNKVI